MAGADRLNTGAHTPSGKSMYSLGGCVRGNDVSTHEDQPHRDHYASGHSCGSVDRPRVAKLVIRCGWGYSSATAL